MGRVSLEIVPRDESSFAEDLELARKRFPCVDTLNIPDILKFDVRIPEACSIATGFFSRVIPHVRAVSAGRKEPLPFKEQFNALGIKEVLVVLGDNPEIESKSEDPCTSVELISRIKKEMPDMKVYAAIDQWRQGISEEIAYAKEKMDAGADGFFTQPFFDMSSIEKYYDELSGIDVFWGLAPVVRESSRKYWENKNKVRFPADFTCTMEWNRDFARKVVGRT
ncbi:MAG: methylenetetrahydrofolate reductase, partial [Candidatus Omnitrophica bacterium]|nr:methylenetetrahydrofolate reductase [Candidatus Omnitrophota bacterium]